MRSSLYAVVSFGALIVPVGIAPTASRKEVKFRTLHVDCGTPVKQLYHCPVCDTNAVRPLSSDEQVKAYEIAKGRFVMVTPEEVETASAPRSPQIEMSKFVANDDLDPTMVERSYFLIPNENLLKPYEIVSDVLEESNTVGLGKATLWKKEYPVAVAADQGVLYLLMLFCADEVKANVEITSMLKWNVSDDERAMARMFVERKKDTITVADLTSESRERVMTMIDVKANGGDVLIHAPDPSPEPTIDYMAALRESVAMASAK